MTSIADSMTSTKPATTLASRALYRPHSQASMVGASAPCDRLVDDSFLRNPYPAYHALRALGPIHWSKEFFGGAWLLPNALRELLRYESPVQYTGRRVATDMMLHGRQLRRGDLVVPLIGAANRDPVRFRNPDALDITRREGSHLSFGHGPHVCIGAALTLMEAEIVFRAILRHWPALSLVDAEPLWNGNPVYRGLAKLRVVRRR